MENLTKEEITRLFSEAVKKAVQEHWDAGRSVYELVDGKVVEIPPPNRP